MKIIPQKVNLMAVLLFVFSMFISCSKDSDLLIDSVLIDPEVSIDKNGEIIDQAVEQAGFVLRNFSFSPTNDAYVQDELGYDQSIMRLEEDHRTSYLMFDLSEINGPIKDVVLQFSVEADAGDGSISIFKGNSSTWTEENLTELNAPSIDSQLGVINKEFKVGSSEKVALNSADIQPELTTLVLTHETGDDLAFASKENPLNNGPKLIVTYEAPEGSEEIVQEEEIVEDVAPQEEPSPVETPQPDNTAQSVPDGYFVTVNGQASNDGKSEATAWNIEYAFSRAMAGDIVYIKAGDYGSKELIVDNSGTSGNPIKFIGYTNTPGDLVSSQGSTFKYGDQIDANKMPLLRGNQSNGEGIGTAMKINESYIHIENIQITRYERGLDSYGDNSILKNIIVTMIGDFNPSHSYTWGGSNNLENYNGWGIVLGGDNSELHNSFALNIGAQAITFNNGNNKKASYNAVYSDNNTNPTDYYFLIAGNTTNSSFTNTTVYRVGELTHLGHGIVFKGQGDIKGNVVDGFTITNTVLELQFPRISNNICKNGEISKEAHIDVASKNVAGMLLANGAHENHFENITLSNCYLKFNDWNDGLPGDVQDASDNNTFENIEIKDAHIAISFAFFQNSNLNSSADNNIFNNCRFTNIDYLFEINRANSGTLLKNCTINNIDKFSKSIDSSFAVDASYENCSWSNLGFNTPN